MRKPGHRWRPGIICLKGLVLLASAIVPPGRCHVANLKRIGPGSAFKVGLVTYGILGLILGILMALFSMLAGSVATMSGWGSAAGLGFMAGFGLASIIIFPLIYGVCGGVFGALGAVIYNLVAGWVGGLEVDIS